MDSYEALMSNPMVSNYQMTHQNNYSDFSESAGMNSSYGGLNEHMASPYMDSSRVSGGGLMSFRGAFPNAQHGGVAGYSGHPPGSSSSSSFSMPYDPPGMQQHESSSGNSGMAQPQSLQSFSSPSSMPMTTLPSSTTPQQSYTSTKPIHSCSYCGLVLSSANALIEHKRIHTGDRPFPCHICGKRFTQKAHLNIHKRTHTGEKPYACHICNKRFAQSSHLSSHVRIHTGEKPFVCGICNIGFTQKQRLDAHLKKHINLGGTPDSMARMLGDVIKEQHHPQQHQTQRHGPSHMGDPNFMHMLNQEVPYIKREVGAAEDEGEMESTEHLSQGAKNLQHDSELGAQVVEEHFKSEGGTGDENIERMEAAENNKLASGDRITTPSFSSEGMFLHPSGYVAYGGIEDNEETAGDNQDSNQTEHVGQQGASRRKPAVVRKLPIDVPTNNDEGNVEDRKDMGHIQKFSSLDSAIDPGDGTPSEMDDMNPREFHDIDDKLDSKKDPPYHANCSAKTSTPAMITRRSSLPQHEQEGKYFVGNAKNINNLGSQHQLGNSVRLDNTVQPETLSYCSPKQASDVPLVNGGSAGGVGLVKVNTRVSLVNFTAEDLLSHLMKRDDVHKCQFCCLIFQDAAMYHIHRNMHDKSDLRRCNLCGKMLADKYDFTAHFLSMHKT